jgi:LPS sulfotransferase NodH
VRPERSYLVCATPRSGSTLLCEALSGTEVAGRPQEYFEALRHTGLPRRAHEYFTGLDRPWVTRLAVKDETTPDPPGDAEWRDCFARVLDEGTTPNGVFGAKMMWGYLGDFAARARTLPGAPAGDQAALLAGVFPGLRYVFVVREDKVRQAVSLWRAIQTQSWRAGAGESDEGARYEPEAVRHLALQLAEHERRWREFFSSARIEPLELSYEALSQDLPAAVGEVLRHIGVDTAPAQEVRAGMRRQADELSEAWVAAYVSGHPPQRTAQEA